MQIPVQRSDKRTLPAGERCASSRTGQHRWREHDPSSPLYRVLYCATCGLIPPSQSRSTSVAVKRRTVRTNPELADDAQPRKVRLARRDGARCRYCLLPADPYALTDEHLMPLARGGTNRFENIGLSCHRCNAIKGQLTDAEFFAWLNAGTTEHIDRPWHVRRHYQRLDERGVRGQLLREMASRAASQDVGAE